MEKDKALGENAAEVARYFGHEQPEPITEIVPRKQAPVPAETGNDKDSDSQSLSYEAEVIPESELPEQGRQATQDAPQPNLLTAQMRED